jgi:hypothetical protein
MRDGKSWFRRGFRRPLVVRVRTSFPSEIRVRTLHPLSAGGAAQSTIDKAA